MVELKVTWTVEFNTKLENVSSMVTKATHSISTVVLPNAFAPNIHMIKLNMFNAEVYP